MKLVHFGIAYFMAKKHDADYYVIVDGYKKFEEFFEKQSLVNFKKTFFARKYLHVVNQQPDEEFLRKFEKEYNVLIWDFVLRARYIFGYNEYHRFTYFEILGILTSICKFLDSVIKEIKPDYLVMRVTDSLQSEILYNMCKSIGIRVLILSHMRLGRRCAVCPDYDDLTEFADVSENNPKYVKRDRTQLLEYLNQNTLYRPIIEFNSISRESSLPVKLARRIRNLLRRDENFKNYYPNYGKSFIKTVINNHIRNRIRFRYLDKIALKKIPHNIKFVYFPLHHEPERSLMIGAPFHTNQLEIIYQTAKALPLDYKLYVKEHPSQVLKGWRKISYYKKIIDIPNVELLHPEVNHKEILEGSDVVVSIAGTASLEAVFYGKPSIVFADVSFAKLSSVYKINAIQDLPHAISTMLKQTVNFDELNHYVNYIELNSFPFDVLNFGKELSNFFSYEFSNNELITDKKMNEFFSHFEKDYDLLAEKHLEKVRKYQSIATDNNIA